VGVILGASGLVSGVPLTPAPGTLTGVSAPTAALLGPTVTPTPGMCWTFDLWGTITTTVDTQTITPTVYFGGVGGVTVISNGALNPNSGATVTGVTVRFRGSVQFQTALLASGVLESDLNFFPVVVNAGAGAAVSGPGQLVVGITPSATAVSMTFTGGYFSRAA
jgi:hypothetical protein